MVATVLRLEAFERQMRVCLTAFNRRIGDINNDDFSSSCVLGALLRYSEHFVLLRSRSREIMYSGEGGDHGWGGKKGCGASDPQVLHQHTCRFVRLQLEGNLFLLALLEPWWAQQPTFPPGFPKVLRPASPCSCAAPARLGFGGTKERETPLMPRSCIDIA